MTKINGSISSLNCSQYANDYEVLEAFPSKVVINPSISYFNETCAYANNNKTILRIKISNEKFIPSTLFCLQSLQNIYITNSNFCKDDELQRLSKLDLSNTDLIALPNTFGTENDLPREPSTLDCSQYANDSEVLAALPFLTPIDPIDRDIHKTYAVSYGNGTIFVLSIAYEKFAPSIIFCLQSLKYLFVRNSKFCKDESTAVCQLSSDIERLTSLEELDIFNTKVTHLPTSFGKLERLKILQLMSTDLVTLPSTFKNLQLLSSLTIYYSKMTTLPTSIGMISSLRTIYLDNNADLRSIQSLTGLQNLIILSAINCSITRIPLNLPNVYYLYMLNNKLTNLNGIETLGSTTNESKLFVFEMNQISALPVNIGSVYKLSVLRVNGNKLTNLPSEIYNIKALIILDIQHNLFTTTRLEAIVAKFKITNPSLMLIY